MTFKRVLTNRQIMDVYAALARGETKVSVAEQFGVSVSTVHRLTRLPDEKPEPEIKWCGTDAKYQWHRRRGEKCWLCADAHAEAVRQWHEDNPEKATKIRKKAKERWNRKNAESAPSPSE